MVGLIFLAHRLICLRSSCLGVRLARHSLLLPYALPCTLLQLSFVKSHYGTWHGEWARQCKVLAESLPSGSLQSYDSVNCSIPVSRRAPGKQ